jgi:hypothetical protein
LPASRFVAVDENGADELVQLDDWKRPMPISRRSLVVASALGSLIPLRAFANTVTLSIRVELSSDRDQSGTLTLKGAGGGTLLGPLSVYGRSDNAIAAAHDNASRDPTQLYGDTPTGTYSVPQAVATGDSTSYSNHSYGPNGALILKPETGDAAVAAGNGRTGLLIHGGDPGSGGKLRATHGCLRLSNSDMAKLMAAILAAGENVQFNRCELVRIDADIGLGDPVCGEDVGDPPPGIDALLNPGTLVIPPPN